MYFGIDDIRNNTFFGVPLEELKPYAKKLQEEYDKTQNNGCEYCDFSSGDIGGIINNVGDSFVMIKSENSISLATDDCLFKMLKLSYCPMCGRKLVEQ